MKVNNSWISCFPFEHVWVQGWFRYLLYGVSVALLDNKCIPVFDLSYNEMKDFMTFVH